MKTVATTILVLALLAAAGGLAFVYSGLADVAATSPHAPITRWLLSTAMENAVERRAQDVETVAFLDEEARVRAGAAAYDEMCAVCHGAPGREAGAVGRGQTPEPPALDEAATEWSSAELYWITKHGIKMTGMPAFGPTHDDEELWEVVALVRRLPRMTAWEYRALVGGEPDAARAAGSAARPTAPPPAELEELRARQRRLEELAARVSDATGLERIDALAALANELVAERRRALERLADAGETGAEHPDAEGSGPAPDTESGHEHAH